MSNKQGEFIWYELMTSDLEAARAFYSAVVGWTIGSSSTIPSADYRLVHAQDADVAGMQQLDDGMIAGGARPIWTGYICVKDVDAVAAAIPAAGGKILMPPRDIPGVGRHAMAADPHGVPFYIMRGFVEDGVSRSFDPEAMGHCSWNELSTPDQNTSMSFYMNLFGWTNPSSMPMGEMGDYRFLFVDDQRIGACMEEANEPAHWRFYFVVPSIANAAEAIKANGGQIISGPHEIPEGGVILIGTDPQGARFGLVAD